MKRVGVLGSSSMLGRALCKLLNNSGIEVLTIGRNSSCDLQFDLNSATDTSYSQNFDVLFHCAASFADDSPIGAANNFQQNSYSVNRVLKLMESSNCSQLVYAGTLASAVDFDPAGYTSYGLSKCIAESQFGWSLNKGSSLFCSLRFTHLIDDDGDCIRHQPWFGRVIAYAGSGNSLGLPDSLGPRNFLHVQDAAELMIRAAFQKLQGVFPVISVEFWLMHQLADLACRIFSKGGSWHLNTEKTPFRRFNYPAHSDDLWSLLNYKEKMTMENYLRHLTELNSIHQFGPLDVSA
jgi:nucleoside-diphosphate-sugar epimerase